MEDDFPIGADFLDEAATAEAETTRAREERKQARVKLGLDSRTEGTDGVDIEAVAALSLPEREERWGFTSEELASATKVVSRLFTQPHLFVGDAVLADTRLFTMISRDRATKRSNPQVVKQMLAAEQSRRKKQQRQEDIAALQKTKMKQERDAALQALLLPPVDSDEDGAGRMITDGSEKKAPEAEPVEAEKHVDPSTAAAAAATSADAEEDAPAEAPTDSELNRALRCHVCHAKYRALHHYYYSLCPECAEFNYVKRLQECDLHGRTVLLTGCRIKIGYEMALSLLRCGATLVGTTRFIHDALARFAQEKDYDEWSARLLLYAVDLRDLWMVEQFCAFMNRTHPKLYAIVNNAAQTIARTAEYTAALRHFEANPLPEVHAKLMDKRETVAEWMGFFARHSSLEVGQPLTLEYHPVVEKTKAIADGTADSTEAAAAAAADAEAEERALMQTRLTQQFPKPRYDRYDTQAEASDTRASNSWMKNLAEVDGSEAAEVMAINALAPFIMNARLRPLLLRREANEESPEETAARLAPVLAQHKATKAARGESALLNPSGSTTTAEGVDAHRGDAPTTGEKIPFMRFIINVSAMEGQFYRFKQTTHPHTNMAKAALNMMTRTSAADYARDGIFMNSVDTGWITDETPDSKRQRQWNGDHPLCPLDEVDAAARCLDLVYVRSPEFGKFWKDYREIPW